MKRCISCPRRCGHLLWSSKHQGSEGICRHQQFSQSSAICSVVLPFIITVQNCLCLSSTVLTASLCSSDPTRHFLISVSSPQRTRSGNLLDLDRIVTLIRRLYIKPNFVHLPSEELWQSTLVHVIRITLEMVSAKVRESKYLASDSSRCQLLGFLRSYVIARVLLLS